MFVWVLPFFGGRREEPEAELGGVKSRGKEGDEGASDGDADFIGIVGAASIRSGYGVKLSWLSQAWYRSQTQEQRLAGGSTATLPCK
jgi:hypothetical protein